MSFINSDILTTTGLASAFAQTSHFVKASKWQFQLQRRYGKLPALGRRKRRLRLIMAPHGSGGEWLARNLIQVERRMPFFNCPTQRISPALINAEGGWELPFEYNKETQGDHPMETLLGLIAFLDENDMLRHASNRVAPQLAEFEQILVHETHGLLMTESLIRYFGMPSLMVVTDPVFCIDKMMKTRAEETRYLRDEFAAIASPEFQLRFLGRNGRAFRKVWQKIAELPESEDRVLYERVLALGAINQMFLRLSVKYPQAETLTLRDLVLSPNLIYSLGLIGGTGIKSDGEELASIHEFRPDINSITMGLTGRPQVLVEKQARRCYQLLDAAGLAEGMPLLSVGEEFADMGRRKSVVA